MHTCKIQVVNGVFLLVMTAGAGLMAYLSDIYHSSLKFLEKNDTLGVKNYC